MSRQICPSCGGTFKPKDRPMFLLRTPYCSGKCEKKAKKI